jgi:hypothetical protein
MDQQWSLTQLFARTRHLRQPGGTDPLTDRLPAGPRADVSAVIADAVAADLAADGTLVDASSEASR